MRTMLKTTWRSVLTVLLACCLLVTAIGPVAAAGIEDELNYVSLGDSMANGYGLPGYNAEEDGSVNGYLQDDTNAYPSQFAEYLAEEYGVTVNHSQLAMSAMRAEDLHYILEFDYTDEEAIAVATGKWNEEVWNATFSTGDYYTWNEFTTGRFADRDFDKYNLGYGSGVANVARTYQEAITDADIITLGIGNANFGVFMLGRVMNALGTFGGDASSDSWIELERALAECDEELRAEILALYEELKLQISELDLPQEIVQPMVNAMTYTAVSYALNYAGILERIMIMNPDAEVMVVGLMNTMSGMKISYEGEIIDLGEILDTVLGVMNAYLAALPAGMQTAGNETYAQGTFYYAEASNVDMLISEYTNEIYNKDTVIRDRFITEVIDMVFPMLNDMVKGMVGTDLVEITRAEVEQYEAATADAALMASFLKDNGTAKAISCAIYLAFEEAVLESTSLEVMDASSFEKLATGLDTVFDGVVENFSANIGANSDANRDMACATVAAMIGLDAGTVNALYLAGVADVVESVDMLCLLLALPDTMADALVADDTVMGLLNLFARMLIGDGLGCHPSQKGHDTLSAAVIEAYDTKYTCADETLKNALIALEALEELLKQAYQYADENGYIDAAKAEAQAYLEQLQAALEDYYAQIKPEIDATIAQLEAEIAQLKAELETAAAELKAEIAAKIAEIEAKIEELKAIAAEVEEKINNILDIAQTVYDYVTNPEKIVELIKEELADEIAELKAAVEELKAQVSAEIAEKLAALEAEIVAAGNAVMTAVSDAYVNATTADYEVNPDSYYVALGDSSVTGLGTAADASYAAKLAAELGMNDGQYVSLAENGQTPVELLALIGDAYAEEIAKADLVTVGFSNTGMTSFVADQLYNTIRGRAAAEMDWAAYVGEDNVVYIEDALAEIKAYLVENGVAGVVPGTTIDYADLLTLAIESYAYSYIGFVCNYPEIVNEIKAINDEALVVLVGMYNPFEGFMLDMDGMQVDVSEYVGYIVDATNVHTLAYAMLTGDAIYVDAPEVETVMAADDSYTEAPTMTSFLLSIVLNDAQELYATEASHEYVKTQILNALNITYMYDSNGDLDMDADIDMMDALLLYNYIAGNISSGDLVVDNADVNADGSVNMMDAIALYQYVAGNLASL